MIRWYAAHAVEFLGDGESESLELLRIRLLAERHPEVAAVLMRRIATFRDSFYERVDAMLTAVLDVEHWRTVLQAKTGEGHDDRVDALGDLALYLALRWQTPTATALARSWFGSPSDTDAAMQVVRLLQPWLRLGDDWAQERTRAFDLLKLGAAALEQLRATDQTARYVHRCADVLVSEIYFASGAHTNGDEPARDPDPGFAREAFAALALLIGFKSPSTVHHAVGTLAHLAPVEPARALHLVQDYVKSGDAYTYDPMASDVVIELIKRYLAEFRDHLTSNADLLTAIHSLLDAFVRVGWPDGVALTYRLGDAFR
ncbi:hypothetical protein [Lentzea cavernae]|uniref:Uncharacterized protein n=1 Tax=Lentzea cavernae TaxID=2020703 RepID=A0ABQ3MEH2_9PSEU|nr:hypothetical protein [Lentzea cavernae]GHH42183.1 hypothetical protein GCM10017774_38070 [Lentzea cavernae]